MADTENRNRKTKKLGKKTLAALVLILKDQFPRGFQYFKASIVRNTKAWKLKDDTGQDEKTMRKNHASGDAETKRARDNKKDQAHEAKNKEISQCLALLGNLITSNKPSPDGGLKHSELSSEDSSDPASQLSSETFDTFKLFGQLPLELQIQIWEEACAAIGPRMIHLQLNQTVSSSPSDNTRSCLSAKADIPVLLHVCKESRKQGLKIWSKALSQYLPGSPPVYMNSCQDVIVARRYFPIIHLFQLHEDIYGLFSPLLDTGLIRALVFDPADFLGLADNAETVYDPGFGTNRAMMENLLFDEKIASFKNIVLVGPHTTRDTWSGRFSDISWIAPAVRLTRLRLLRAGKKVPAWIELWFEKREALQTIGAEVFHKALKDNEF